MGNKLFLFPDPPRGSPKFPKISEHLSLEQIKHFFEQIFLFNSNVKKKSFCKLLAIFYVSEHKYLNHILNIRQFVIANVPFGQINCFQAMKVVIFLLGDPWGGAIGKSDFLSSSRIWGIGES